MCLGSGLLKDFLSTRLLSTFRMRCMRNMTDVKLLEDKILLLKKVYLHRSG